MADRFPSLDDFDSGGEARLAAYYTLMLVVRKLTASQLKPM